MICTVKGIVRWIILRHKVAVLIPVRTFFLTGIKTDQYYLRYRSKTTPPPENSSLRFLSSLRKLQPPMTSHLMQEGEMSNRLRRVISKPHTNGDVIGGKTSVLSNRPRFERPTVFSKHVKMLSLVADF